MSTYLSTSRYETPYRAVNQQQNIQKTFRSLDLENSGIIKKSIIISASMYTSDYYDRRIIQMQLQKCPQEITFDKFNSIFQMAQVYKEDTSSNWIFKLYDKKGKGYIDRQDLIKASQITGIELSQEQITQMLRAQNPMVQGKVYLQDFAQIMSSRIQQFTEE